MNVFVVATRNKRPTFERKIWVNGTEAAWENHRAREKIKKQIQEQNNKGSGSQAGFLKIPSSFGIFDD